MLSGHKSAALLRHHRRSLTEEKRMKALLVILSSAAILAAVFSGGCSLIWVGSYLWHGPKGEIRGLGQFIAALSAGVGLVAAAVIVANVGTLFALFGRSSPRLRLMACLFAVADVISAVAALAWLVWADSWTWAHPPWTWLAKAAACLLAVKGVLIWRLVGRAPSRSVESQASDPRPA
jgi:hypothetical protein